MSSAVICDRHPLRSTRRGQGSRRMGPVADADHRLVEIRHLRAGDHVDLHGDRYADPDRSSLFEFEYAEVEALEAETPDCMLVHFSSTSCGFPPDWTVRVARS